VLSSSSMRLRSIVIVVLFVLTSSLPTTNAEGNDAGYPAQILLDISDGTHIIEMSDGSTSAISGTIQDEAPPNSATWELKDSFGTRQYIDFTDTLVALSDSNTWKLWAFEIEIDPLIVGPCACTVIVTVIDNSENAHSKIISIFISPNLMRLPPTVHIHDDADVWHSQSYTVNALSMTDQYSEPWVEYTLRNSTSVRCSYLESQQKSELYDLKSTNSSQLSFWPNVQGDPVGQFTFDIDLTDFPDGWYDLVIYSTNPLNQEFSYDCTSFRVDNTPPKALIMGPETIPEGIGAVVIDGSSSIDLYWGIQGLTYIWSVTEVGGGPVPETLFVIDGDSRGISIYPTVSGIFEINLAIADQAGNIGQESKIIEIQNVVPIARLQIDGTPIFDNSEFILTEGTTALFDASDSVDTSNDAGNLRYVWRINNVPTYEGESREFIWPDEVDGEFILTIEVIDDNSEASQISILVKDGSTETVFPISIIILILSTIFFIYSVANMRKQKIEPDIPKWS